METNGAVVDCAEVKKVYRQGSLQVEALRGLSLEVTQATSVKDLSNDITVSLRVPGIGQVVSAEDGTCVVHKLDIDRGAVI